MYYLSLCDPFVSIRGDRKMPEKLINFKGKGSKAFICAPTEDLAFYILRVSFSLKSFLLRRRLTVQREKKKILRV